MALKPTKENLLNVALHTSLWILFLFLPFIVGFPFNIDFFLRNLMFIGSLAAFFYFNAFFLIPTFLTRGKIGLYFLLAIAIVATIIFYDILIHSLFQEEIREHIPPPHRLHRPRKVSHELRIGFRSLFTILFIFGISTSYKLLLDYFRNERKKKDLENETLVSEVSFLKSQVSPHFLFNTLNNIYSLSLNNSPNTSEAVMKLSQLLRYMLYESDGKQVGLTKEIEYIQNYIELQKIRVRQDVEILFAVKGDYENKMIEPMLLIPFIENAFKHGVNYSSKSVINIHIDVKDDRLHLEVENPVHPKTDKDKASGIGLTNVKRRLELLYPHQYQLDLKELHGKYIVKLNLSLKK
jgi:hypothetical protein